jgi:hypothetical protein
MCIIHFGSGADYLTLRISGRVHPDSLDYWDGNWLRCTAEVSVGTFYTTFEWQLRNEDLIRFMNTLGRLDDRSGVAILDTTDGWLDIQLTRDDQNQIEARCQLGDNPEEGDSFEFLLMIDHSYKFILIEQLREVLERFPVVGRERA